MASEPTIVPGRSRCGFFVCALEIPWAGENPGRREGDLWKVNGLLRAKRLRFG